MEKSSVFKKPQISPKLPKLIVSLVVVVIGFTLFTEKIPQGYVGVVYSLNGGVKQTVLNEGLRVVMPWQEVTLYSVATEQFYLSKNKKEGSKGDESFDVQCSDGAVNVDLTVQYSFDKNNVPDVFKRYRGKSGEEIMNDIMRGKIKAWVTEVTKDYTTMEVYLTEKAEVNDKLTRYMQQNAEEYGIVIEEAALSRTSVPKNVEAAIRDRQAIAQEIEKQKLALQKTKIAKEQTQLEAERRIIEAKGEAEANKIIQQSMNKDLMNYKATMKYLEKWNGKRPNVESNGGNGLIVDVGKQ